MSRVHAILQLLRPANLFTAIADVLAGAAFAGVAAEETPSLMAAAFASVCLYASGVVLNDVFDAACDARERPQRPIPSGAITRRTAAVLGVGFMAAGLALCLPLDGPTAVTAIVLAGLILLYDGVLKATPLAPVLMGGCRACNVALGMSLASPVVSRANVFFFTVIGLYVSSLTFFARGEVAPSRGPLRIGWWGMLAAVAAMAGLSAVVDDLHESFIVPVVVVLAIVWFVGGRAVRTCSAADVQRAVKVFVLGNVLMDATMVWAACGPVWAAAIVVWLVPAFLLARRYSVS